MSRVGKRPAYSSWFSVAACGDRFGDDARIAPDLDSTEKGWAYDVGSAFGPGKYAGEFSVSMQTKSEVAEQAIEAAPAEIRRMREQPVSEQERKDGEAYLTGNFPLPLDTSRKIVGMLATIEYYGLGLDYVGRYLGLISAVTAADVQRVAQKYLDPNRYALSIMADLSKAKIRE